MIEAHIKNGPSKFDLMQTLFTRTPVRPCAVFILVGRDIGFDLKGYGKNTNCWIDSVEREDNSAESWNIAGCTVDNQKFTAYYHTQTRTGTFRFVD